MKKMILTILFLGIISGLSLSFAAIWCTAGQDCAGQGGCMHNGMFRDCVLVCDDGTPVGCYGSGGKIDGSGGPEAN